MERQVSSINSSGSAHEVGEILNSCRKKGIKLWCKNGQLHYTVRKGTLTSEDIEKLRKSSGQIVALLDRAIVDSIARMSDGERRLCQGRVPLAFSQLTHWNLYRLRERSSTRMVSSGIRLCGPTDVGALQRSIAEVVRHHDALRTRIVVLEDGIPTQEIASSMDHELRVLDLRGLAQGSREIAVMRLFEEFISEPIDVTAEPLFAAQLLKLSDHEHVLIVALEHIIADGFSLNILLRDILTAYMQVRRGEACALPRVRIQFAEYSSLQRDAHASWMERHGGYWNERLRGCTRLRFSTDDLSQLATAPAFGIVKIRMKDDIAMGLREWCRNRRTTLVMGVLTAYVALVLRWCKASDTVVRYQTDGRFSEIVQNTIGYFAFPLHLRLQLLKRDTFTDLLERVVAEYCRAYEHADSSYIESQTPRPGFTRNTWFNWLPQEPRSDHFQLEGLESTTKCSRVILERSVIQNFELDIEPIMAFQESDEIRGYLQFPLQRFSVQTMERFARNFMAIVEELLRHPGRRISDIALV
jgi:hypothetical protein